MPYETKLKEGVHMSMTTVFKWISAVALMVGTVAAQGGEKVLSFAGGDGPGKGKKIVLVSGDEEYRTEESMPMLAKVLSQHHGFDCVVLFAWDSSGTFINPNNQQGVIGWEHLDNADLMLIGTRFRRPDAEARGHIAAYLKAGKPVIGIRTSTHAFRGGDLIAEGLPQGRFGPVIIGDGWVAHHGHHKVEGARGVIEAGQEGHAILRGVSDVFAPSDVYTIKALTDKDTILMRGQVTKTLDPASKPLEGGKNDPMMALAWLHPYQIKDGTPGTTFATTAGASSDLLSEDLRRMLVNAAYHLLGIDVPERANVAPVDAWHPSFYGFTKQEHWVKLNRVAEDYGLGKSPKSDEPKGPASWEQRAK